MDLNKLDELFDRGELAYGSYCQPVVIEDEEFYIFINVSEHCDRHAWDQKTRSQKHQFLQSLVEQGIEEIKKNNQTT